MSCKSGGQEENEQNKEKEPTLVVGNKPNGKSQFIQDARLEGLEMVNSSGCSIKHLQKLARGLVKFR